MMIESAMALRFPAGSSFCSSSAFPCYRSLLSSDEHAGVHVSSRRISHSSCFDMPCYHRVNGGGGGSSISRRKNLARNKVRATAEHLGSASDPIKYNGRAGYHPFEDVAELASGGAGDARLTTAETVRTVVEVNSKATLLFSGVVGDEVHENILWPDLPYATDEHGNIYFQVNNDEDIMRALASDTHMVHVIIGLDTMEMMNDIEISGPAEIDFGIEEIGEEDSDFEEDGEDDDAEDDDYEEDWVSVLEDEDDLDESDGNLGDWAKLDTMHYSHPMYFAKKLAEVASDDPIDCMERPPVGIVIHGLLRPALIEEKSVIQKLLSGHNSSADVNNVEVIVDSKLEDSGTSGQSQAPVSFGDGSMGVEELEKDENLKKDTSFYKLEMIKIQLLSVHGHPNIIEVEDYRRARPDSIAPSAAKIMSRLKAGGEKTGQALKSLCWRSKGIQVEATSEYSAERQLNDLLFPRIQHKTQKKRQTRQNEW
ncbi:uncharacterized protein At3g49140-like isoform X2 [Punica granatum]|uniref:Uncharacterized protein At3g49140-like isoform X2 n=1 Tax=Punica granatum TaxID=22663 RepID=A0A6P8CYI3_PUNGR|nr:uncharacterized protein At3g49140-like isoform X2 [Punica granatum]